MFVDTTQFGTYYYRPSMIALDDAQQVGPIPTVDDDKAELGAAPGRRRSARGQQAAMRAAQQAAQRAKVVPPSAGVTPSVAVKPAGQPAVNIDQAIGASGLTVRDFLPRDWFDSSVYRNILDMINTLGVVRNKLYNAALGHLISTRQWKDARGNIACRNRVTVSPARTPLHEYQAFWGYAHQFTPAGDRTVNKFVYEKIFKGTGSTPEFVGQSPHVQQILKNAGYVPFPGSAEYGWTCPNPGRRPERMSVDRLNKAVMAGGGYSNHDLIQLVRQLDWEMNRVHLPLPFNLRQWAVKYNELGLIASSVSYAERIKQLEDLKKWIIIMREKIRQAINASNLNRKVAEESLRKEDARILKENQEQRKAREAARLKQIEEERKAARELIEAEKKRIREEARKAIEDERKRAEAEAAATTRNIQQQKTKPVTVAPTGKVVSIKPQPAPIPIPTVPFKPPSLVSTPPTIAPERLPVTETRQNWLPLVIGGAAALLFMG